MISRTQGFIMKKTLPFFYKTFSPFYTSTPTDRITLIENIQHATHCWSSNVLVKELQLYSCLLNKIESEQLQQMCRDYTNKKYIHSIFENDAYLFNYVVSWATLTTLPVICTLALTALLGLSPAEAPELAQLLIAVGCIPVGIGMYGKAIVLYNTALAQHYARKIESLKNKTMQ